VAKKKVKSKRAATDEPAFEQSLEALTDIVEQLESGQLSLDESLNVYEKGIRYLKVCHKQLDRAQRRIEVLSGLDAEGNPITQPYDDSEDASLEAKQSSRSKRRTRDADETGTLF
jgi:exodeoxyribonuclease VII small subunit